MQNAHTRFQQELQAGFRLYDGDTIIEIVPKLEQLGFAARLFGTTFFDYIYRTEHIPRYNLEPWQKTVTPMFDELFTAVLSPTFGVLGASHTLMKANEPNEIISISNPDGLPDYCTLNSLQWDCSQHVIQ